MRANQIPAPLLGAVGILGALVAVALARAADGSRVPANELAVALAVATYAIVAVVIEIARHGDRVGRLMLLGATGWGVGEGLLAIGVQGTVHAAGSVPAAEWFATAGTAVRGLGWLVLVLAVPLVFPDGRPPWGGRRVPVVIVVSALTAFTVATLLAPTPLERRLEEMDSPTGLPQSMKVAADVLALSALALCVVALLVVLAGLVHRWRVGDEVRHQQLLWLCLAFAVPVLFLPLLGTDFVQPWMFAVVTLPVPVAIGVGMLQRRLYDLQFAVSRTLTYAVLSAAVAGLYALTVGGVGALLQERGAPWLPWVAAGVVAVSFAPLRNALQQGVNQVTYGQWSQPAAVLAATGRRLVDASDVPGLLDTLVTELGTGLGLAHVDIRDVGGRVLAGYGDAPTSPSAETMLTAYGAPVGALRWSRRPLRETDLALLDDVARQLGGVVHAASLLETIRQAQHRLVLAREEERRRLRRDIHDGLGPALASLALQVDMIRNQLGVSGVDPDTQLVGLRSAIQAAVVDVRRIVEGLRPPALDDLGLEGALEQLTSRTTNTDTRVEIDLPPLPPMPAAVEVAIFRISQEALTNVVRHAAAAHARIQVRADPGAVTVVITDDGAGTAQPRIGGVGLGSMTGRATELGGTLRVTSAPGRGTAVHLVLPLVDQPSPRSAVS